MLLEQKLINDNKTYFHFRETTTIYYDCINTQGLHKLEEEAGKDLRSEFKKIYYNFRVETYVDGELKRVHSYRILFTVGSIKNMTGYIN